ncbi:hypothetical protein OZD63_02650 [Wolbachia endosymbiont of Drosophila leontia]|uniref:hypothetical protein n=1 Tax=Wolbachia endosymbiont of Drosophila leontia TaxID=3002580 RepID=UPI0023A95ECD|nr:hypothetical protein [Wolbachia endosymbiont of Drosophila leontia]MDE5066980.1 hypothetical protein [Wolbachia endosymbiont of Drosophila leontia]
MFQGLIPYGAQLLLASTIAGVSPLAVVPHVYYCYVLGIIAVLYIVSNTDNIANLEFKRVIPRELLRQKAGAEFVYNVDLGGFYE